MMKQSSKTLAIFTISGINSLIGWNAVLAALDYFQAQFKDYNVYSYIPIPLFFGYIIIGLTFHSISNQFKYVNLIIFGNIVVDLALAGFLIVSILVSQSLLGFILILVCSFLIGIGANINEITAYAMINYLSAEVVSNYTVGTALSGLFITAVRAVILAIGGSQITYVQTIIYFLIAIAFNICTIVMNVYFCRSSVYKQKIEAFMVINPQSPVQQENHEKQIELVKNRNKSVSEDYVKQQLRIEKQSYMKTMKQTFLDVFPYPLILIVNYVITFMLFPGPSLKKNFSYIPISWSAVIFLLSYNIGDTLGKFSASLDNIFNKYSFIFLFFCRFIFFLPIIVMANGSDKEDDLLNNVFFPFFNQFLFGFTNGFVTNCSFIMSFRVTSLVYKKYSGILCGLSIELGIIIGTALEVPLAMLIGIY